MTLFKSSLSNAVRSWGAVCTSCDADRARWKVCVDKTQFEDSDKSELLLTVCVVMTSMMISEGCFYRAHSCEMLGLSNLLEQSRMDSRRGPVHNPTSLQVAPMPSALCEPSSFGSESWLRYFFVCFHICSLYLYADSHSCTIGLQTPFVLFAEPGTLCKPGPRLGLVGITVIS